MTDHTCYAARFCGAPAARAEAECLACNPGLAVAMRLWEDDSRHLVPVRQVDECEHVETVCAECLTTWAEDYAVTLAATNGGGYLAGQLGWTTQQVRVFDDRGNPPRANR